MSSTLTARAGRYTVQLDEIRRGVYRVEVLTSAVVGSLVDELTRSFGSEADARAVARVITVALRKPGATVADAQAAVVAHIDAAIGMLSDAAHVDRVAQLQDLRAGFIAEAAGPTLDQVVPAGEPRQVRATMAGAHLTAPSKAALALIRRAATNGGIVLRGNGVSNTQLMSLARKGLGVLAYAPSKAGRRDVVSLTLTARGWKLAGATK